MNLTPEERHVILDALASSESDVNERIETWGEEPDLIIRRDSIRSAARKVRQS